jgi:hypothetical protein
MSNIAPLPLNVVVVKDELMDWVQPVYTINAPSSLKSFNAQDVQTYSNTYINATLNLNSSDFVVDPSILHLQPVTITITGSSSNGQNLLLDGCFALRSNALYKSVNTIEVKLGSTSNTTNVGDVMSAIERYNNFTYDKFVNNFGLSYLDQTQSYDDLVGAPKNPLGLFSTGTDIIEARGAYPMTVVTNSATTAVIQCNLVQLIPISPLVDKIRRDGSPIQGLSHLNNISFNITFYSNAGNRMVSLAQNRPGGDVLTVTNINVQIGQPTFSFVQLKSRNESIPRVLAYPLVSQERYIFSLPTIAQNAINTYNVSSFNLTRVPHSMLLYARPSNNALLNTTAGVFIPDAFCRLSNLVMQYDGQTLFGQSVNENLYSMCVHNGCADTWTQWNGRPVVKSLTNSTYMTPVGSVLKLEFGKDISLYPNTVVGSYNECAISLQVNVQNLSSYTQSLELYMVMLYSDVIELYDNNLAQISNIPVSHSDIMNSHDAEHIHRTVLRHPDVTGSGLLSSVGNFLKSPKLLGVVDSMKQAFNSPAGRMARNAIKSSLRSAGHSGVADALHSVGFGMEGGRRHKKIGRKPRRGGAMSGGGDDFDGGAMANMSDLAESLYE